MTDHKLSRRRFVGATAVGGAVGLAGCSGGGSGGAAGGDSDGGTPTATPTATPTETGGSDGSDGSDAAAGMRIRHAFEHGFSTGGLTYYPVQWGTELGFFREEEVGVDAFIGMGGGASMQHLAAGNFQINTNAMDSTILARAQEARVSQILTWAGLSHGLVAQSGYESFDDLPERIDLGISNPTSGSTGAAYLMLSANGVDPERVTLVSIGGSRDRYLAVSNGDVDVGASVLDVALEARADPNTGVLTWAWEAGPDYYYMGTAVHEPWLERSDANYDSAVRHTTAVLRAIDYAFENQDEFAEWAISRNYLGEEIAEEYMALSFGDGGFNRRDPGMSPGAVRENNMTILNRTDNLEEPFPDQETLVRTDVYEDAKVRLEDEHGITL
jgi:ABC-type nitrate/sulfonate/bicarbonate transport system substrate-binding protein